MTLDNQPEDIYTQMDNIKKFLEFLIKIKIKNIQFSDPQITINLQNIYNFFKLNNSLIIYYKNKRYIFNMNKENKINFKDYETNREYYTYRSINPPKNRDQFDSIYIENIKIFHGIEKPEDLNIDTYSRWCEPFSKKNITFTKSTSCII
jgi:hypothetical protein